MGRGRECKGRKEGTKGRDRGKGGDGCISVGVWGREGDALKKLVTETYL